MLPIPLHHFLGSIRDKAQVCAMVNMRLSKPLESGYSRYGILMYPFQAGCVLYAKRRSIVLPGDLGDEFHHDWWVDTSQLLGSGAGSLESVRVGSVRFWVCGHFHQDVCMTSSCSFGAFFA